MTITKEHFGGTTMFHLSGWLDTNTSPDFAKEVEDLEVEKAVVLDFQELEFISSAGLRQVVACARKAHAKGAAFSIIGVSDEIMSIFRLTGLHQKLNIQPKK